MIAVKKNTLRYFGKMRAAALKASRLSGGWLPGILLAVFSVLGIIVRIQKFDFVSKDAYYFLLEWYDVIRDGGGLKALGTQVGDYNIMYQTIIALFTYLPIKPLYAYKILSCIFDVALAVVCARIIYEQTGHCRRLCGALAYGAVLLSPLVFLNSAMWAQCDSIYTFFCVTALWLLSNKKDAPAFLVFGVALTFKLQAVFVLPMMLYTVFCRNKVHLLYVFTVPVVMIVLSLPGIIAGRSVADIFTIYFNQTNSNLVLSNNYPSMLLVVQSYLAKVLWILPKQAYAILKTPLVIFTFLVLACYMLYWLKKKVPLTRRNFWVMSFILCFTAVLLLPCMHERYGYVYEILALLLIFLYPRTLPLMLALYAVTYSAYANYLYFSLSMDMQLSALFNAYVYIMYIWYLKGRLVKKKRLPVRPEA